MLGKAGFEILEGSTVYSKMLFCSPQSYILSYCNLPINLTQFGHSHLTSLIDKSHFHPQKSHFFLIPAEALDLYQLDVYALHFCHMIVWLENCMDQQIFFVGVPIKWKCIYGRLTHGQPVNSSIFLSASIAMLYYSIELAVQHSIPSWEPWTLKQNNAQYKITLLPSLVKAKLFNKSSVHIKIYCSAFYYKWIFICYQNCC